MAAGDQTDVTGTGKGNGTSTLIIHVVPEHVMAVFQLVFSVILQGIIPLAGIISNGFNMVIFYKLGIKDSMGIGLFTLSVSDFLSMLLQLGISISYIVEFIYPDRVVDAISLLWFFAWPQNMAYRSSYWIITLISIERCVCVVWPFKVKEIFTGPRCAIAIAMVFVIHLCLHIPIYVPERLEWVDQPYWQENVTTYTRKMLQIIYNEETAMMAFITDISVNVVLGLMSQAIILVCTVWMIVALKSSSKVRQTEHSQVSTSKKLSPFESSKSQLSYREKRMVKMVLFLAILLTVCDLPRLTAIILLYSVPGLSTGLHTDYFTIMWVVSFVISSVGSSSNFLVYIRLNANYRNMLKQLCRCGRV